MVSDSPIQVLIINNVDFKTYLSKDYRDNIYVLKKEPERVNSPRPLETLGVFFLKKKEKHFIA